jgi:DNA adenine methylase
MQSHPPSSADHTRPFLKWTGGKQRLLKQLLPLLPNGCRLIEPFVGAGSVFLGTNYPSYVLSDANPDLAAVWQALKESPEEFCRLASQHFVEENRSKEAFMRLRERFNRTSDVFERATLLPYLNRFGFNGVYRVNAKGIFNCPYGHPKNLPSAGVQMMLAASQKLQRAQVMCSDFSAAIETASAGDVGAPIARRSAARLARLLLFHEVVEPPVHRRGA